MNELLYTYVSLSLSGSLLAFVLFFLKPLVKDSISKRWQYYIWIIVVARLLIPYTPELGIIGQTFNNMKIHMLNESQIQNTPVDMIKVTQSQFASIDKNESIPQYNTLNYWNLFKKHIGLVWFFVAILIFVHKVTTYNNFIVFIKTGNRSLKHDLSTSYRTICANLGINKPIEVYVNSLVSSPMLISIANPFIVLPNSKIKEQDLYNIVFHEFTHYKRLDIFYKWITQIVICLHWFNPLIYLIGKEINKNCELSCDEAIIKKLDSNGKQQYGNILLSSVKVSKAYCNSIASLTLTDDAKLLKERLGAIMKFKKKSKFTFALTTILTLAICFSSTFIGAYAITPNSSTIEAENNISTNSSIMKTAVVGNMKFYLVESEDDLRAIGSGVYSLSDNYMLNCDISLTKEWLAIGNDTTPFTGIFDGNGFTINNLTLKNANVEYAGLFGFAEGATIHNVTLTNVDIKDVVGKCKHVAPLVAIALNSKISDCIVK